ncbi:glycoside hydrolase family 27 protein [Ceratobasidium sp. AG-Ba]|nr:glycoside hydrolase family 27 protein [Ceratobasidium sp. AG-Ba]QRW06853.1 glycoside hydrolase family 27 protein [Ceratobasidium sp. AG-Ba]
MLSLVPVLALVGAAGAVDNGLARTPQMGWNTWNRFGCNIAEDLILSSANALVRTGLRDLGYKYVLMDDCWQADRREEGTGKPVAHPKRFPNGIKHVSNKVHDLNLKLGIYSSAGVKTCAGRFGSLDYERIDAKTYAEWGIDYLKYDNCYNQGRSGTPLISFQRYANMSRALGESGRAILYSMCNWGEDGPWNWASEIANSWRMSGDIKDSFTGYDDRCPCTDMLDCKLAGYHCSVTRILDFAAPLLQKGGPGRWNDLDMLEVGNGGMTFDEYGKFQVDVLQVALNN